ncbi:MAG: nitrous oxide reductase family maturation protein NosD [Promethearchaeota archaeon]
MSIVSKQGVGDYWSISEALADADPNSRILIKPGAYQESLILDKPVELLGEGPTEEIIIHGLEENCIQMETDHAVIRGMTLLLETAPEVERFALDIPQGELVVEDCDITSNSLACVGIYGRASNPVLRRCRVHHSRQDSGILVYEGGGGTIEDCEIFENNLHGVEISEGSTTIVQRCKIYSNGQSGIDGYDDGEGLVEDCDIYRNGYHGVSVNAGGNPVIRSCRFHDNRMNGFFSYEKGKGVVEICDILDNGYQGVEIREEGDPVIKHSRIRGSGQAGIHVWQGGKGTIENCDILENGEYGVAIRHGGDPVVRKCRISRNGNVGVYVWDQGRGTVEECVLTDNTGGAWFLEPDCLLTRRQNTES